MRNTSIRTRLFIYQSVFVLLFLGVASFAIVQLSAIDKITETIAQKWLPATRSLGEMADLLTEIHVDRLHDAIRRDHGTSATDNPSLDQHELALDSLIAIYAPLASSDEERRFFDAFRARANAYLKALGEPDEATFQEAYTSADQAADALDGVNMAGATRDAAEVDRMNDRAVDILLACAALGLGLAGWIILIIRNQISRPLAAITDSLSGLAAGNLDITVPELDRRDEIGAMAKAFDVFRQNAFALQTAHEATEAAQQRAQALARHDALTGLPNRRVFSEELDHALARARHGEVSAILFLDLDRFKPVNDIYGHAVGDVVLCEVARRLRDCARREDTVARLGGDEFAVIAAFEPGPESFADAMIKLANRLIASISKPIFVGDSRVEIGVSIGIANCPLDGTDVEALLRAPDIAMYRAKREGSGTFRFFEPSMDRELRARADLEAQLRKAVAQGEIRPHYQPLIALSGNRLLGFEVLARWHHPTKGVLLPETFIPLAEEINLIPELTFGLLRRACLDARTWPTELMFSLNISPQQLKDTTLPTRLLAVLSETGYPPNRLEIEITETALVSDLETAKSILTTLQGLGIRVALDDFGTGYSSLYHLRELSLDKIKIDRSFVQSMKDNPESEKIVNAILGLTKSLGLPTIAEGIEDAEILKRMIDSGCEFGQGFYFGKAMEAGEASALAHDPFGAPEHARQAALAAA